MPERRGRLQALFRDLAGDFLKTHRAGAAVITVTGCDIRKDLREAVVRVSVYPETREEETLRELETLLPKLRSFVGSRTSIRTVPHFTFIADRGEKNRKRIDELLDTL